MTAERYRAAKRILLAALERAPADRSAFVREACGDDAELRGEVESLLAEDRASAPVLVRGVVPAAALADALGLGSRSPAPEPSADGESPFASEPRADRDPPGGPAVGHRVKHFELVRELGQGGMGQVFLARDTKLGRPVALKFLKLHSRAHVQRFLAEARATAQCQHENIVVIYEANEAFGRPYLALEYLDGEPLGDRLAAGPLPPEEAVAIVVPVVRALVCAHALGIVHRDLKPDNIFLTRSGKVKVLDFGIAKLFEQEGLVDLGEDDPSPPEPARTLTRHGQLVGTVPYMSPEQWGVDKVDHCTDVWAVGILFWHMLAQQHPVSRPHPARLKAVLRSLDEPLPSIGRVAPELSPALVALVDDCLRKRKEDRVASAEALLAGLEGLKLGPSDDVRLADASTRAPASGTVADRPLVLRVTPAQAWAAMFVLGWLLLGLALGAGVGTSYVRSINWGPLYIVFIPLMVAAVVWTLQAADEALGGLGRDGMLLDATGHFSSRNEAWARWRGRLGSPLWIVVPLLGGLGVSIAEWWQRVSTRPVAGEWWVESPVAGFAGSLVQGLVFAAMIVCSLGLPAFAWAVRDLATGRDGVRLAFQEHAEDGQGGFGRFREPLVGAFVVFALFYIALWCSSVESMAIEAGSADGRVPLTKILSAGGLFSVGPAHYSTRMTSLALLCGIALMSLTLVALHRAYWAALREQTEAGGSAADPSPWLVPGLRLDVLMLLLAATLVTLVFFKLGLAVVAAAVLGGAWWVSRALSPG